MVVDLGALVIRQEAVREAALVPVHRTSGKIATS
jgi:hypothetical protein